MHMTERKSALDHCLVVKTHAPCMGSSPICEFELGSSAWLHVVHSRELGRSVKRMTPDEVCNKTAQL